MPTQEIEEFARILVREVRDAAVRDGDMNLRADVQSATAKRWRQAAVNEASRILIPDCVDEALFFLLNAIDQGTLRLQYVAGNGKVVDLTGEGLGELAGWYIGSEGWRARYAKERFVDDFSDVK